MRPSVTKRGPDTAASATRSGLYVHFPFCRAKCPYCHFDSSPLTRDSYEAWRDGIEREAGCRAGEGGVFDTLYIGGGTPSIMAREDLFELTGMLAGRFRLEIGEFSLEANPGTADGKTVGAWLRAGVTRVSIGVQSFDDRVLAILDRGYSAAEARTFCLTCRGEGVENLGLDLMIGVPGESPAALQRTIEETLRIGPDHVSVYMLENVAGLPFEKVVEANPVDEDATADAYELFRERLKGAGLGQDEISNYAKPGRECRHNLKYWRYQPFLGLGPSACSHFGNRRWCNRRTTAAWAAALRTGEGLHDEEVELTPLAAAREALVFGLRLQEGVDLEALKGRFGVDLEERFRPDIEELAGEDLLWRRGKRVGVPTERFLVSNRILSRFV